MRGVLRVLSVLTGMITLAMAVSVALARRDVDIPPSGQITFAWSRSGNHQLYTLSVHRSVRAQPFIRDEASRYSDPAWSPDGAWIAFTRDSDIYRARRDGSDVQLVTGGEGSQARPAWSPDGMWIAFQSVQPGTSDLFIVRPDGRDLRQLTTHPRREEYPTWSPDGQRIAFTSVSYEDKRFVYGRGEIYILSVASGAIDFVQWFSAPLRQVQWSPAGDAILYNTPEVVGLISLDGQPQTVLFQNVGPSYSFPAISPDGKQVVLDGVLELGPGRFESGIYVMRVDGADLQGLARYDLTNAPAWVPTPKRTLKVGLLLPLGGVALAGSFLLRRKETA